MRPESSLRRSIASPRLQAESLSDRAEEIDRAWMDEVKRRYEAYQAEKIRALDHEYVLELFGKAGYLDQPPPGICISVGDQPR